MKSKSKISKTGQRRSSRLSSRNLRTRLPRFTKRYNTEREREMPRKHARRGKRGSHSSSRTKKEVRIRDSRNRDRTIMLKQMELLAVGGNPCREAEVAIEATLEDSPAEVSEEAAVKEAGSEDLPEEMTEVEEDNLGAVIAEEKDQPLEVVIVLASEVETVAVSEEVINQLSEVVIAVVSELETVVVVASEEVIDQHLEAAIEVVSEVETVVVVASEEVID